MGGRVRWAPKVRVEMIVRLYRADAEMRHDHELVDDVGWRLLARAQDVLLVSCPGCGWSISAAEYHSSFEHRDLNGAGAREAFADYVARFPRLRPYADKMLAIDRLVHAVHTTGGVAARNLFEGRARDVLATLDELAASGSGVARRR